VSRSFSLTRLLPKLRHHSAEAKVGAGEIRSHLPGKILEVKVLPGDTVSIGDVLMVLESMKMEHRIESPINGKVTSVSVIPNQAVETGKVLVVLDALE
jgi:propionyl-CoA carboxylase alpha chain